jgi:uncharacterized membrane protein (UPF0182 family)
MSAQSERKKGVRLFVTIGVVLVLLVFGKSIFQAYADWMWFRFDAQQPEVFAKTFGTRAFLWTAGLLVAFFSIYLNARASLRSQAVYDEAPQDENARAAANVLAVVQKFGRLLAFVFAVIVGLGIAGSLSGKHMEFWAFQNATSFGRNDPLFGLDLSFYVFKLPWYETLLGTLLAILSFSLVFTLIGYLGSSGLAKVARVHLTQGAQRFHIALLLGLTGIVYGAKLTLGKYELLLHEGPQFVGPGFAQSKALPFYGILGIATILLGVATIANGRAWRPWIVPLYGAPALIVLGIATIAIYPGLVQSYKVKSNSLTLEPPFALRAIESTRYAFGLDKFEVRDFAVSAAPTKQEIDEAQTTLRSMRLWDPDVLRKVYEERQSLRNYYRFFDVDVDRYVQDGEQRLVMLAPRDILNTGLDPRHQNWQNQHLRYTHGFGAVVSAANETANDGQPSYWLSNFPPEQGDRFPLTQQRTYFAHYPVGSLEKESYVLLNTKLQEFDYPADPEALHKWGGTRGIPIAGGMAKFVFSTLFGEVSFYTTGDITNGTRLIYRRDIIDRAALVYPFLRFDADPYIVLIDGRLYWILDAFTVTDRIPYSDYANGINYIRNSVKIVLDAYSGDMVAYAVDPTDPLLKTWMKVFPGLVRPASEVPTGFQEHFRYAEGLFDAQSQVMAQYHVTNPVMFLSNEDAWQIALERASPDVPIESYYVQMRIPGEDKDGFMLIRPFSTRTKNNMIGWMAAFCDPEDYGRVIVFKFPRDTQTQGPVQVDAKFAVDPVVADINRQFTNDQSQIVPGNLLVIPLGSSVLYVKPLFLENRSRPIPELRKVVLGLQNKVVVGNTYEEALAKLFGTQQPERPSAQPSTGQPQEPSVDRAALKEIESLLEQADAALRAGDFGRYGELQKQARDRLRRLAQ